jgi:hypothetical protein
MMQFFYWLIGIFVGVLTIVGATVRITYALAKLDTTNALLAQKVEHVDWRLEQLEKKFETATRSQ